MKHRPPAAWPAPQGFTTHEEQVKFMKNANAISAEEKYEVEFSKMRDIEMLWYKIHIASETNEGLRELMDRAMVYYRLLEKKDSGGNDGGG